MAVKDGSGPRPAAHTAKRCFLNCLETSFKPCFSCHQLGSKDPVAGLKHHGSEGRIGPAAGSPYCQTLLSALKKLASNLAFSCRQLESKDPVAGLKHHGSEGRIGPAAGSTGARILSQASNTMAVKDGSGPRPAAHTAKRCFLNCLETIASNLAVSCRQLGSKDPVAGLKHHGSEGRTDRAAVGSPGPRTLSQASNTMAVKDGSGPRPAAHTAKRCFLNCLETSFKPCCFLPSARRRVQGPCRRPQTPWQ